MNGIFNFGKILAIFLIVAFVIGALSLWYQTFLVGAYYAHSGLFLAILVGASPIPLLIVAFWAIRKLVNLKPSDLEG